MFEARDIKGEAVFVNIGMALNTGAIRTFTRNGREKMAAPVSTMRGGDVLNGIRYPSEVIRDSIYSFEQAPVPYDHPTDDQGRFISARSAEGLDIGFMGGRMENVGWVRETHNGNETGRVKGDMVFDVERLKESAHGRETLERLNKQEPMETSTGLFLDIQSVAEEDDGAKFEALWCSCDHNAVLPPGVEPAASIEDGTGVFVNRMTGEAAQHRCLTVHMANPDIPAPKPDPTPASAGNSAKDGGETEGLLTAILGAVRNWQRNGGNAASNTEADMADDVKNDTASAGAVEAVANEVKEMKEGLPEMIANAVKEATKPLVEAHEATVAANAAKEAAERKDLTEKVVAANALTEDEANETPLSVLRKLAGNADGKAGGAASITGSGDSASTDAEVYSNADLEAEQNAGKEAKNDG